MCSKPDYFSSRQPVLFLLIAVMLSLSSGSAAAQTTAFTYQGRLTDGGTPANGNYDLQFALWDSSSGGSQIGSTQVISTVPVSSGIFSVTLDFGANAFPGANRFLEIGARLSGASSFTPLTPRQQITSTPYAVRSGNATTADTATNATQLGGIGASQYVQTSDSRLTDSRTPIAGSSNYIQNSALQQASSNFNITGDGTAAGTLSGNVVNATTQYNLGGSRVLSTTGTNNLFAGITAGASNTTGDSNVFIGPSVGHQNSTGQGNTFLGFGAGFNNTTASQNSFVGGQAGVNNTTGSNDSFFGFGAGLSNTTGGDNTFAGHASGLTNTTGQRNSFFGKDSGRGNTTGDSNSFFGWWAGLVTSTGVNDAFFGSGAGQTNTSGSDNSFFGTLTGQLNSTGGSNSFFGLAAGSSNSSGSFNSFIGEFSGVGNTSGNFNTTIGGSADVGASNLDHATAIGAGAVVSTSNTIALGRSDGSDTVRVPGKLVISSLGVAGSTTLCRNFLLNEIAPCSSSLRYKKDIALFTGGLDVVARLRPITFTWKDHPERDLGLAAEEVGKVEPLLVTLNANGEIEGVKYDHLNVVLINAIKQQQTQIESLRMANAELSFALNARLQAVEKRLRKRARSPRRRR